MEIEIKITYRGQQIAKADALSFESAEEELGKLERYCKTHTFCSKCGEIVRGEIGFEDGESLCSACAI